ncbi:unnamed protein product [Phytophthora lilii]|uniref:Unnamed protein product n=1 Tax=Phytophthora lilii TaxID=2077276 RepID=A0A9W6WPM7_9STRA|nr:unnamed protein product [Phytophthora lilii]
MDAGGGAAAAAGGGRGEPKKAAKDTGSSSETAEAATANVIDLLSDEEKDSVVGKDEKETQTQVKTERESVQVTEAKAAMPVEPPVAAPQKTPVVAPPVAAQQNLSVTVPQTSAQVERRGETQKSRKRKAPREVVTAAKRPVKDVVVRLRKRAEMAPSGAMRVAVRTALNATIAVEDADSADVISSLITTFVAATTAAGRILVDAHKGQPAQTERHLEDTRLSVATMIWKGV